MSAKEQWITQPRTSHHVPGVMREQEGKALTTILTRAVVRQPHDRRVR